MSISGKFREILYIKDTPHRVALSFGIGVFIAICPLLGLHTLMGVGVCFLYRFNKFALFVGIYITNPWTIIPIYTFCTWLGALMLGVDLGAVDVDWAGVSFSSIMRDLEPVLMPFVVGSTVVSVLAGLCAYFLIRRAVKKVHKRRAAVESMQQDSARERAGLEGAGGAGGEG